MDGEAAVEAALGAASTGTTPVEIIIVVPFSPKYLLFMHLQCLVVFYHL